LRVHDYPQEALTTDALSDCLAVRRLRWLVRVMPPEDRRVLFLGAASRLWRREEVLRYGEICEWVREYLGGRDGAGGGVEASRGAETSAAPRRVAARSTAAHGRQDGGAAIAGRVAGEGELRRRGEGEGIAGPWFVTPHAVRQYQTRARRRCGYEQALGELVRIAERARRVKPLPTGAVLYRTGRPDRWRLVVREDGPGSPQLVTVLRGHDSAKSAE